jgi:hypothetical protein
LLADFDGHRGAGYRSVTENIDTTTAGRMMMQMVGSFAEFERAMIGERTSAGLAAARARVVSAADAKNWMPRSVARLLRASAPAANPVLTWHASTTSAGRPSHVPSHSTE